MFWSGGTVHGRHATTRPTRTDDDTFYSLRLRDLVHAKAILIITCGAIRRSGSLDPIALLASRGREFGVRDLERARKCQACGRRGFAHIRVEWLNGRPTRQHAGPRLEVEMVNIDPWRRIAPIRCSFQAVAKYYIFSLINSSSPQNTTSISPHAAASSASPLFDIGA
jgi:hypothetical protein